MSNIAGKAYAMTAITPMKPHKSWINRLIFMTSRAIPSTLGGLLGLSIIHFARWALVKRDQWPDLGQGKQELQYDYMLFCSNFNGTWDQYIDAFSDGIPAGLDLFWWSNLKYPHSIPELSFKRYIVANQFGTDYYYNATPGSAQRDIKAALRVRNALSKLERIYDQATPKEFAAAYRNMLLSVQNSLGSVGVAPAASLDTLFAAENRQPSVVARWGDRDRTAVDL